MEDPVVKRNKAQPLNSLTRRKFIENSCRAAAIVPGAAFISDAGSRTMPSATGRKDRDPLIRFESSIPAARSDILESDDVRWLATLKVPNAGPAGLLSDDAGKTWSTPFRYLQDGQPLQANRFPVRAVIRLANGPLGMVYGRQDVVKTPSY